VSSFTPSATRPLPAITKNSPFEKEQRQNAAPADGHLTFWLHTAPPSQTEADTVEVGHVDAAILFQFKKTQS
jgi:hypothetical protein